MQNQNLHSWAWGQGAPGPFPGGQPVLPSTFTSAGVDQNSLLTTYQQMYGSSPAQPPADYNQWTTTQFQQWQQWQQWQEKYQQWQAQYGKKYEESLAAMGQNSSLLMPAFSSVVSKPAEAVTSGSNDNPPLPSNTQPVPPPPPEDEKPPLPNSLSKEVGETSKQDLKDNLEELSEAEKTFDVQFKQWESEFEEWKKQNQDHPDKAQYREYEKKWEAWREQLLQRLEHMRKKRLEKANEASKTTVADDVKEITNAAGAQGKHPDTDYGYRTQPPSMPQNPLTSEPPKFEKPSLIGQSVAQSNNAAHRGYLNRDKNIPLETESNREIPFRNNQSFNRGQGLPNNFERHQEGTNSRLGNFEGGFMEGPHNSRFRNLGQFEGPRFGNFDNFSPRRFDERNFGSSAKFSADNFKNERDFNRGFDGNKEPFGNENGQGLPSKPKVPSLFDIQVEKPSGLINIANERKSKIWEKVEDFDKKPHEGRPWGSCLWPKSAPSPWMQPWELEKIAVTKPPEVKPWERDCSQMENSPWLKDGPMKRDLDRAELSGYVGNILAKLGKVSVVPTNLGGKSEELPHKSDGESEKKVWSEGFVKKSEESLEKQRNPTHGEINCKNHADQDQGSGRSVRGFEYGERVLHRGFDRFDDSAQVPLESTNLDIDDRMPDKFRRDGRFNFGWEDRVFSRSGDRRNCGNDDRFFERGPFARGGRDDRDFKGRFPREDIDERFGLPRNGRRGFDRDEREGREGRGSDRQAGPSFERFGRHDQVSEPVWKPQVFDYSQGRPMRLSDTEEGFKISTVVDYSHGERKHTFDYYHGEGSKNRFEVKSFDYGYKADAPTIIDYGHGVDSSLGREEKGRESEKANEDGLKGNTETQSHLKRSRSPRGLLRSRSRSPHCRFKRNSASPPCRILASRNRDRFGRQTFRPDRNCLEDKLSPSDGDVSKPSFSVTTVLVEDLICRPGRESRPNKLVFIMRGLPGSGKTYVTKLIKDKEVELGGDPPRILSLDDYFMTEVEKETVDSETGRKVKTKTLEYEYEAAVEPHYRSSLVKAFKKTVSDGFFSFIIVDSVNEKTKDYEEMWSFAKQKGFQVYVAEMDNDVSVCTGRNIHKRTEKEVSDLAKAWEETPIHYLRLDVRSLLQSDAITEVEMEVVSDAELEKSVSKEKEDATTKEEAENEEEEAAAGAEEKEEEKKKEDEEEDEPGVSAFVKSRWDQLENSEQNLDRLDGLKRRREGFHATMEDFLQLPDDFDQDFQSAAPGKKRVRWADLEERKQQEKMRAIGFVVGQTDWSRMTDPTFGESALTRTKYI